MPILNSRVYFQISIDNCGMTCLRLVDRLFTFCVRNIFSKGDL